MNLKTVLLTGAAGFIGCRTTELLLEKGYTVIGVDNVNDYYDTRLKEYRLRKLEKLENFKFYKTDVEDIEALEAPFVEHAIDCVINLAARAGVRYSMVDPFVYVRTNTLGSLNLLELCRRHGTVRYVLASTSSLYAGQPMPFNEDLPVNTPISPYAASKKGAEALAYSYHYLYDIEVSVLRYFTVYGPAGRPDMSIFRFIKWIDEGNPIEIFGDGSQSRDFTYIDDIAEGTVKAAETKTGFEVINLGGNSPFTLNHMIELIEQNLKKKSEKSFKPFFKADIKSTWADIEKAGRLLGWHPKVSLEEGIERTVQWHVNNRDWLSDVKL